MANIEILLATCNSERFLQPLVDSILAQTYADFALTVRDDGSRDGTLGILSHYDDSRLRILEDRAASGSAQDNFYRLLAGSNADYIMFADADDVWLPGKVAQTFEKMLALEQTRGSSCPLLVHTDLAVVNEALGDIAPSMFRYEKLSPERKTLKNLLVQNNVTGCTVMMNRALRDLVPDRPRSSVMHDWWLALAAAAFGDIAFVDAPLILYRQHGQNQVGAYDASDLNLAAKKLSQRRRMKSVYRAMYDQARCFADVYADRLTPENLRLAREFAALKSKNKFGKIRSIVRNGFYKNTLLRNIGQFLTV